jgi:hypothetical protein
VNVAIQVIPHDKQRYETVGDWYFQQGWPGEPDLTIKVSDLGDWRYNMLVAVHELVEALLCKNRGITQAEVDKFDRAFEAARKAGNEDEPGDDPKAPYRREHFFATNVEALLSAELNVDWAKYEKAVTAL